VSEMSHFLIFFIIAAVRFGRIDPFATPAGNTAIARSGRLMPWPRVQRAARVGSHFEFSGLDASLARAIPFL
jgi:hypothetical protein